MKDNHKLLYSFVFLLPLCLMSSCSENTSETQSYQSISYQETYRLVSLDTLEISINNYLAYNALIRHVRIKDKEYIYAMTRDAEKNNYFFYEYPTGTYAFSFDVPIDGPNGISLAKFPPVVVNMDSIFIQSRISAKVSLVDSAGTVHRRWDLERLSSRQSINHTTTFNYFPMQKYRHYLFLRHIPTYHRTQLVFYQSPLEVILNFQADSVIHSWGFFPKEIREKGGIYGKYTKIRRIINRQGDGIYSYDCDPHLYTYDLQGNMSQYYLPSKYLAQSHPTPPSGMFESGYEKDFMYMMKNGSYYMIIEDPYRELYYRIIHHPSPPIGPKGQHRTFWDRPFSIQIIDKDFRLLGETLFPENRYNVQQYFVAQKGLYLGYTHDLNSELKEDSWVFVCFSPQKIVQE